MRWRALLKDYEAQQEQDEFNRAQQEMQRHQPQSNNVGIQDGTPMSSDDDGDEMEDGEYREDPTVQEDENSEDYEMDDNRARDYGNDRDDRRGEMDDDDPRAMEVEPPQEELTLKDLRDAQMKRDKLEAMCSEPYFEDFIRASVVRNADGTNRHLPGLFCRVFIGNRMTSQGNQEPVYRVCEMLGVEEYSRPYTLQSTGRTVTTALLITHGRSQRVFRIQQTSNSPFTEKELIQWKSTMEKDGLPLPTKDDLNEAYLNAIKKHKNFKYDERQIAIMREQKSKHRNARNLANPHKEKLRIQTLIASLGDHDEKKRELTVYLSDINREIERRSSASSQSVKVSIASINEKNKIKNKRLMLKAREKERKSQMMMRGRRREKDPFTRAITAPQIESFNTGIGELDEMKKKKEEEERRKKEEEEKSVNRAKAEEEEMNNLSLLEVARNSKGIGIGIGMQPQCPAALHSALDAPEDESAFHRKSGTLIQGDTVWATAVHDVAKEFVAHCQNMEMDIGPKDAAPPPQFGRNTNPSKYGSAYTKRPDDLRIITIDDTPRDPMI